MDTNLKATVKEVCLLLYNKIERLCSRDLILRTVTVNKNKQKQTIHMDCSQHRDL